MKLYREVKASERLPEEGKEVAVKYNNNCMCGGIYGKSYGGFYDAYSYNIPNVESWLEPIEITEEEIADIIHDMPYEREYCDAEKATEAIISKLEGE